MIIRLSIITLGLSPLLLAASGSSASDDNPVAPHQRAVIRALEYLSMPDLARLARVSKGSAEIAKAAEMPTGRKWVTWAQELCFTQRSAYEEIVAGIMRCRDPLSELKRIEVSYFYEPEDMRIFDWSTAQKRPIFTPWYQRHLHSTAKSESQPRYMTMHSPKAICVTYSIASRLLDLLKGGPTHIPSPIKMLPQLARALDKHLPALYERLLRQGKKDDAENIIRAYAARSLQKCPADGRALSDTLTAYEWKLRGETNPFLQQVCAQKILLLLEHALASGLIQDIALLKQCMTLAWVTSDDVRFAYEAIKIWHAIRENKRDILTEEELRTAITLFVDILQETTGRYPDIRHMVAEPLCSCISLYFENFPKQQSLNDYFLIAQASSYLKRRFRSQLDRPPLDTLMAQIDRASMDELGLLFKEVNQRAQMIQDSPQQIKRLGNIRRAIELRLEAYYKCLAELEYAWHNQTPTSEPITPQQFVLPHVPTPSPTEKPQALRPVRKPKVRDAAATPLIGSYIPDWDISQNPSAQISNGDDYN